MKPEHERHDNGNQLAEPPNVPRLIAAIGNGSEGYYSVRAEVDRLSWRGPANQPDRPELEQEIKLSTNAWRRFWADLDRIGAWDWDGHRYHTAHVFDGTDWQLEAANEHRVVRASGSNGYPGIEGPDPSAEFRAFCRAVARLAGGNTFR